MHREGRKGGHANGDVRGPFGPRRAIANPLTFINYNGLSGGYVYDSVAMLHPQHAIQDNGVLIELGSLAGLLPAARTAHVGHAGLFRP